MNDRLTHDDGWRDKDNIPVWATWKERLMQARPWSDDE